jgi:ABC-2 type transport system ATP-binding protein
LAIGLIYQIKITTIPKMKTAIETKHLVKRYGDVTAVDDLSLRVAPGEIYAFLGLNGAG